MSLDILRDLTESVGGAVHGGGPGRGRYARTPDFTAPATASSRPSSDRGVTFHFQHKTISKRTDVSQSAANVTSAAPHQAYIERPSAIDRAPGFDWSSLGLEPGARIAWIPEPIPGSPAFLAPPLHVDAPNTSFGSLGRTKSERQEFWREVEAAEGRAGRVQCRIISEIPHELDRDARIAVSRDFCRIFEEHGLPYWAALHAPAASNDPRNHHLHISYYDRPAGQTEEGQWDFSVVAERRKKSRHRVETRPWKRVKPAIVRARAWVKSLRRRHAEICNFYLGMAGLSKRYDPRPYRESGIAKTPTEHLGNKASALESFGLETTRGMRNAQREIAWRFERELTPWSRRERELRAASGDTAASKALDAGRLQTRRAVAHDIAADLLTIRVNRRRRFLATEAARVTRIEDPTRIPETSEIAGRLDAERSVIELNLPEIVRLADRCRSIAISARRSAATWLARLDSRLATLAAAPPEMTAALATPDEGQTPEDFFSGDDAAPLPDSLDGHETGNSVHGGPAREPAAGAATPAAKDGRRSDPGEYGFPHPPGPTDGRSGSPVGEVERGPNTGPGEGEMPPPTRDEDTAPGNGMRVRMPGDARADTPDETLSEAEAHAVSDLLSRDLDPRTQPAQRSRRSSPDHDPILAAIEDVSRGRSGPDGVHRGPVRESAAEDFPDAFPVVMPRSNEELDALDRRLVTMTNRQVRRAAIATRDATDLSSPGVLKSDLNRGWVVLRAEAERRGVDLETGLQHIARATDPERAALHRDQEFLKTIDLQKELERQRLR